MDSSYLDLLRQVLTREMFLDDPAAREIRRQGRDWPPDAETMVGALRLRNIQDLLVQAIRDGVPGDVMETGVWRGGACILMAAILRELRQHGRTVWVVDSFQGCPPPSPQYPQDDGDRHHTFPVLAVPQPVVANNFRRYGLLDTNVRFLQGWFKDVLPGPVGKLALLRLDGDLYGSTIEVLNKMYDRVEPGGYVIVDDYGAVEGCRKAVDEFRAARAIRSTLRIIDWTGVYWKV